MRKLISALTAAALAAGALGAVAALAKDKTQKTQSAAAIAPIDLKAAKSGVYTPDAAHRHILFNYVHQGYSTSYVRWREWTGELNWNAEQPEKSTVSVTIDAAKVDSGVDVFDGHLKGEKFFDTAKHPTIAFASTSFKKKGPNTGAMTGDLTIKGVKKPVTLDVTINKAGFEQRGNIYKVGFSARGLVKRSDWGMDFAVPIVGDEVTIIIEAEWQAPAAATP